MSHEVVGGWSILHDGRVDSFSFLFYECWWCGLGSIFLRVDESTCFEACRFLMISSPFTIVSLKHLTHNNSGQMGCCHWKTLLDSRHWNSLLKWSHYRIYKAGCFCRHFCCERLRANVEKWSSKKLDTLRCCLYVEYGLQYMRNQMRTWSFQTTSQGGQSRALAYAELTSANFVCNMKFLETMTRVKGRCVSDASNYKCGHLEWNHDRMDVSMKHWLVFTCWRLFSPLYVVF